MARGSVIKRKTRFSNFSASYYVPGGGGKRKFKSGFLRKKDAQDFLREVLGDIHHGTYRPVKKKTFAEYAESWLELRRPDLKPSTFNAYTSHLDNHLVPAFGERIVSNIDTEQVERWMKQKQQQGELSAKSIKNLSILLHKVFKDAQKHGYFPRNRPNPTSEVEKPRWIRKKADYLNADEVRRLLAACHPDGRTVLLVAVMTGMRQGEIFGLRWGDLQANRVYVQRSLYWDTRAREGDGPRWSLQVPKSTKSTRTVALAPAVVDALAVHRKQRKVVDPEVDDFIFASRVGVPDDPRNYLRRFFFPALDKADVRRIRFHDLRHTYVALQIQAGAHPKYIQEQVGHASYTFTMDAYGGLYEEEGDRAVARLEATVFGKEGKTKEKNVVGLQPS